MAPPRKQQRPPRKRCATPGCKRYSGHGVTSCFCKAHAQLLGAIRDSLEDKTASGRYRIYGTRDGLTDGA